MAKNNYGRKIKRSRNLYRRKKSGARRAAEITGMIVLVGGLVFVGYFCGKPLLEYIKDGGNAQDTTALEWTPPETTAADEAASTAPAETGDAQSATAQTEQTEQTPAEIKDVAAAVAPNTVLTNAASLSSYVKNMQSQGYTAIVLELKDETGNVLYKSSLSSLKDTNIVTGTMSLAQIKQICDAAGIIPIVSMNTLLDKTAPAALSDVGVRFADDSYAWLDARAENGGKQWADPTREGTAKYLKQLVREITAAGFGKIVFTNTVFPEYSDYDLTILSKTLTDTATRYKALVDIVSGSEEIAAKNSGTVMVEVSAKDMLESYNGFSGSAEVLRGRDSLGNDPLVVVFSRSEIGSSYKVSDEKSRTLPSEISALVTSVYKLCETAAKGLTVIPCIDGADLSDGELEAAVDAVKAAGYTAYFVK